MAINKKLIHFKTKQKFNEELANGNILDTSIVFIKDTKQIYTHGQLYDGSTFDPTDIEASIQNIVDTTLTKTEATATYQPIGDYITKTEVADDYQVKGNYVEDDVYDGVYAVDANGQLIDYNTADSSCLGVALVKGEHKFMIAKADATDGTNTTLYYDYDKGDLSLTNYSNADGTNRYGYLPKPDGSYKNAPHLSDDFTTWTAGVLSDFNGKTNTEVIAASSSNSKDMCKVLETFNAGSDNQGHTDWYVPACGQLALMYLAKTDINAALAKIGGTALESDYWWSSSEYDSLNAWYVGFNYGSVSDGYKLSNYRVRFVRDISVKPLKERVSDLENKLSNKQNTLVSGTNIKTINGQSLLGGGNITISEGGGSSSGGGGAYAVVNHGDGVVGIITPNVFHVFEDPSFFDFTFGDEQEGVVNEYILQISFTGMPTPMIFPDTIQWANGEPIFNKGKTYQISIVNNIGLIVSV